MTFVIGYNYVNLYCYSPYHVRNDEANRKIIHHYIYVDQNKPLFQVIPCSERPIIVDTKVRYIPEGHHKGSNAKNSNNYNKKRRNQIRHALQQNLLENRKLICNWKTLLIH